MLIVCSTARPSAGATVSGTRWEVQPPAVRAAGEVLTAWGTGLRPLREYTWGLDLGGLNGAGGQTSGLSMLEAAGGISGLLAMSDTNGRPGTGDDLN
jgi:hypothetical protein